VIDGQVTSPGEWAGAAQVPIQGVPGGRASFLWSDEGLYGLLKGDWWLPATGLDESLCVSVTGDLGQEGKHARLFVTSDHGTDSGPHQSTVRLARVERVPWDSRPLPANPVQFASAAHVTARSMPWTAEFLLPWTSLMPDGKPPQKLFVHVYLICGQRPYSFLKLDRGSTSR
jgi:hypothetical protein